MNRISTTAIVLLVALRLVIGWHFFVEGFLKVKSRWIGTSEVSRPFSSEGYFREATGPLGPILRGMLSNPDDIILSFQEIPVGVKGINPPLGIKAPSKVREEWTALIGRYEIHYKFSKSQSEAALGLRDELEASLVKWILVPHEFKTNFPSGSVEKTITVFERVEEFKVAKGKVQEALDINWAIGKDVEKARVIQAKSAAALMRADLLTEFNTNTATLKAKLESLPLEEQILAKGPMGPKYDFLGISDMVTAYALLLAGMGMLAGCFTRSACFGAALFLFFTYLLQPSFPWLPAPPMNEGNYIFVNKNVVECFALLVLASLPTGYWFGVDAMLGWFRATQNKSNYA